MDASASGGRCGDHLKLVIDHVVGIPQWKEDFNATICSENVSIYKLELNGSLGGPNLQVQGRNAARCHLSRRNVREGSSCRLQKRTC